jgi:16S rRNA C1402 N4-methylase RsmH
MPTLLTEKGTGAIITFNSVEESVITYHLSDVTVKEPNITEIIKNPQSRSAKLYIYKKKPGSIPNSD